MCALRGAFDPITIQTLFYQLFMFNCSVEKHYTLRGNEKLMMHTRPSAGSGESAAAGSRPPVAMVSPNFLENISEIMQMLHTKTQ